MLIIIFMTKFITFKSKLNFKLYLSAIFKYKFSFFYNIINYYEYLKNKQFLFYKIFYRIQAKK